MYYKELSLPFDPWKDLPEHYFEKEKHQTNEIFNKYVKREDFNKDTLDWFRSNGLYLIHSMIFSYLPHTKSAIHTDGFHDSPESKKFSAMNFSIGGSGSLEWYEPLDINNISPPLHTGVGKSPYNEIHESNARLLDSYKIKNPVLIDVDAFHRGVNDSDEHRYSLTLRWLPNITFKQALEIFQPYFLD